MADLTSLGAAALAALARSGEALPSEIVEAHLRRIETVNPALNAIIDLQADRARQAAAQADAALRNGKPLGPLHGVPITIKSSIAAQGFRLECGSAFRRGEVADRDAAATAKLKAAGAIVIGATNAPEFLMAYETDNALYGRTNSPFDPARTPGGSSGGESAAVASGCSAAGFGSDGGGSVRVPAHFCGLYGLKPTPGVISRVGHWPACAGPSNVLGQVGPLTKTAEDLQLLLEIAAGPDAGDPASAPVPLRRPDEAELRSLRIGWFDQAWATPAAPEVRQAVRAAAAALAERGFRVEPVELQGLEQAPQIWRLLFGVCLRTLIEASTPRGYRLHPLAYEAMASAEEEAGATYKDLLWGWVAQDRLRLKLLEQMERYPVLLCPVASVPAFRHGQREWTIDGQTAAYPQVFTYSQVFNVLGNPAAAVPAARSPEGLPIGVQIVGRHYEDATVTAIAKELEAALGAAPQPAAGLRK